MYIYIHVFEGLIFLWNEMINVHSLDHAVDVSSNIANVKKYIKGKKGNMAPIKVDFTIEISKYSKKIQYILSWKYYNDIYIHVVMFNKGTFIYNYLE